ncbi:polysaccharide deacetylase family protein [Thalassotalea euphylliae]|nr:polysaccharide deacetylase family protein [Thalassotalea euphylliae]
MMNPMKNLFLSLIFPFAAAIAVGTAVSSAQAAVILQYHHVSTDTPASTSISPQQFENHMRYLKDRGFTVVPLSTIVNGVKNQEAASSSLDKSEKLVAITFDDAYLDILTNGKPILDAFNYPYTIFVNPSLVEAKQPDYLNWQQLKMIAEQGAIIANHGWQHQSLTRVPDGIAPDMWLAQYEQDLRRAEQLINDKVGQSYRYFAYPYGEYTPEIQLWLKENKFVGFSQQSGAVGPNTDLTAIPRFPASQPYDKLTGLRDKLNALPFSISLSEQDNQTIYRHQTLSSVTFHVDVEDFKPSQLNCYVSGLGKQKVNWLTDSSFQITFSDNLPVGRVRCNCTAPSLSQSGRYYWYSKPWFILNTDGSWYPL